MSLRMRQTTVCQAMRSWLIAGLCLLTCGNAWARAETVVEQYTKRPIFMGMAAVLFGIAAWGAIAYPAGIIIALAATTFLQQVDYQIPGGVYMSPWKAMVFLAIGLMLIQCMMTNAQLNRRHWPPMAPLLAFGIAAVLSMLKAPSLAYSVKYLTTYVIAATAYIAIYWHMSQQEDNRSFRTALILLGAGAVLAAVVFIGPAALVNPAKLQQMVMSFAIPQLQHSAGLFSDRNYLAGYMLTLFPVFVAAAALAKSTASRAWWLLCAALTLGTTIVTLSRAAAAVLAGQLAILFIIGWRLVWQKLRQRLAVAIGLGAVIAIGAVAIAASPHGRLMTQFAIARLSGTFTREANSEDGEKDAARAMASQSTKMRMAIAQTGWRMFRENPVLGVGFGQFAAVKNHYMDPTHPHFEFGAAHNTYLRILAETGIAGFAMYGWLLCAVTQRIIHALRHIRDRNKKIWLWALATGWLGMLLMAFTLDYLEQSYNWAYMAMVVALADRFSESENVNQRSSDAAAKDKSMSRGASYANCS